ncbi:MAG TPA: ABC transporter permease [Phototrophicaceae bacterium]|nr:ABC transporter permease [Phototrophicaceae bacterium]
MATTTASMNTTSARRGIRVHLTRMNIFSVLFILIGAWMLLGGRAIGGAVITKLTFGEGLPELPVPTMAFTLVVGVLYLLGGIVGLIPGERLYRIKWVWLFVNGVLIVPAVLIIAAAGNSTNVTVMFQVSVRLATPIVLGALAGIWCERSGVVNIAIEGMMLTGACFGFVAFVLLVPSVGTPTAQLLGVIIAVLSGGAMALLHGWLSITFKTDQVVSGTVINILALGVTSFVRRQVLLSSTAGRETLPIINIPVLSNIPILGPVFFQGQPIFYSMFILLIVTHVVLFYTRWGLRTRAVGENPRAADTLGINVQRNRWINVFIGGLIAGLAGAWFSLETTGGFDDNMTSGRGFIALAAMIFGKYTPIGAFGGGLLFGFSDALGQRFQFLGVPVPPQFLQMVPYVITIVVLAGLVGKAVAPKADGIPYEKEGH